MKKITSLFFLSLLIIALAACSGYAAESLDIAAVSQVVDGSGEAAATAVPTQPTSEIALTPIVVEYDSDDLASDVSESDMTTITLEGDSIALKGEGAAVNGNIVTISAAGSYRISGVLNDGQIRVDTQDEETVTIVLDGVDITHTTSAPIYVINAAKTVITLAEGTENFVTDGDSYLFEDETTDEPNAAIFSKDDLTINGSGSLTVDANYNNGIGSKDDLKITGGVITMNTVNDGIKGRDSIAVMDGTITIDALADGMQANNDVDLEKGYILIEGGTVNITAGLDGIQAETQLLVSGGSIDITAGGGAGSIGGGSAHVSADSAKGLKAGLDVTIDGGTIDIDAADDALHSNGSLTINGGEIVLASSDHGIHADASLVVNNGNVTIAESYEGLESAVIILNDGSVRILSSDDGINVSSGEGDGTDRMDGPDQNLSGDYYLEINGGYLFIDAGGDGLDSNGLGTLNDGVVVINGPSLNMNGTLDVGGMLTINGGFLIGVGSAGMAQAPSTASTQYSVLQMLPSAQPAGSIVHVESEDGEEIVTFVPTKSYETIVLSSPELENGATYLICTRGTSTGTATDGLYADGAYAAGTQVATFTISGIVTGQGTGMGGFRDGGPGGDRPQRP